MTKERAKSFKPCARSDVKQVIMCDCTALHLRKLCTKGNSKAQCNLGVMFQEGLGVAKDAAEAVRLYRLAAAQGHARAQYGLGFMFEFGRGVGKKRAEAINPTLPPCSSAGACTCHCSFKPIARVKLILPLDDF